MAEAPRSPGLRANHADDEDWKYDSGVLMKPTNNIMYLDQQDPLSTQVDMAIYCQGGYIPAHRSVLASASRFIRSTVADFESEIKAPVHLLDFHVDHVVPVINLLYTGRMTYKLKDFQIILRLLNLLDLLNLSFDLTTSVPLKGQEKPAQCIRYIPVAENATVRIPSVKQGVPHRQLTMPADLSSCSPPTFRLKPSD